MFYDFPFIEHIDQVKAAIEGRPEFIVAEREHFDVVNYMVSGPDTFPELGSYVRKMIKGAPWFYSLHHDWNKLAILRECRGLIFDKKGRILSRRLHKFFNVNERNETQEHSLDVLGSALSKPHVFLEKLDGSMITPIYIEAHDAFRWGTKMGITDVSMHAEAFVSDKPVYTEFARFCHSVGITPIFEYCSRYNRIVIDHPVERLVLIAMRFTTTGVYLTWDGMRGLLDYKFGEIPLVDTVEVYTSGHLGPNIRRFAEQEGTEGSVLRFENGHMIKLKSSWYVQIHKAKDNLLHEKNVIKMILDEKVDDVKPFLLEEDANRLSGFEFDFLDGVQTFAEGIIRRYESIWATARGDRRAFAQLVNELDGDYGKVKKIYFNLYGLTKPDEVYAETQKQLTAYIARNLQSQTKVDSIRFIFDASWNYYDKD